jgi:hypothetical protein
MLTQAHYKELLQSGIDPTIINLNFKSLKGDAPLEYLLYGLSNKDRNNSGRIRSRYLKQYKHVYAGGWWVSGEDVVNGGNSVWGQFKPDRPRKVLSAKKLIKYESPRKAQTGIFALRISYRLADEIAKKNGLSLDSSVIQDETTGEAKGFWQWVISQPKIEVQVTEGAKKAACLLSAGFCAIALPGIFNGFRQPKDDYGNKIEEPYLIPELKIFAVKNRQMFFCFDYDTNQSTQRSVRNAILKTSKLLALNGVSSKVVRWSHLENAPKGIDDLINSHGLEAFKDCYSRALTAGEYELENLTDLSQEINYHENSRYLEAPYISPSAQIIGLKSAKGTGKTQLLEQIARQAQLRGQKILILTHRIQLAKALCDRLGIDHIDSIYNSPTQGALGIGLCVDSLHKYSKARFDPEEWGGALIILDEVEQVLWHMVSSSTCRKNRVEILQNFQKLLHTAASQNGRIILSDADLSAISLTFVKQLIGQDIKTHIVENSFNPVAGNRRAYFYNSPQDLLIQAKKSLLRGEKIFLCTGSQKTKSTWSSRNLETYFKDSFPNNQILRIDAESVSDPNHPAFCCIENINIVVEDYDLIIASPTIETGVSIDLKDNFAGVYGIFQGVQTVDAVCQSLERVRQNCDRHIFAASRGLNCVGRGATNLRQVLRSTHEETQANINCLLQAGLNNITLENIDLNYQQASLVFWAKRACIVNLGMKNYCRSIADKLAREGYELSYLDKEYPSLSREIAGEVRSIKERSWEQEKEEIAKSESLSDHEFKKLESKKALTQPQRQQLKKARLAKLYDIEITPEIIERDSDGWYAKLQLCYYLTVGRRYLRNREQLSFDALTHEFESEGGSKKALFKPDANKKLIFASVRALEILDIKKLLDKEETFTKDNLKDWMLNLLVYRWEIYQLFGIRITEKSSPITIAQSFLNLLGLKLFCVGRFGSEGARTRCYKMQISDPDGRGRIYQKWIKRDLARHEKVGACPAVCI